MIPKKQRSSQADWTGALVAAYEQPEHERAETLVTEAAARLRRSVAPYGPVAFGWSGGKDSQALRIVAAAAGVTDCCLVITDLEYPAFLAWATDHMPWGLSVVNVGLDLAWLAAHPEMIFPRDARQAGRWFSRVQSAGLRRYCQRERVGVLLLGRRRADGNFVGPAGADRYRDRAGFVRYSPLANWSHEDVLCVLGANRAPLPPCYGWPRGFRVGTGPWPARQWAESENHGWAEVDEIDPGVVRHAATMLPAAERYLAGEAA